MFQRDYFMRMIEQMTQAIGQIIGLKQERKHQEALLVIDEQLQRLSRFNAQIIDTLSEKDLVDMLTVNRVTDHAGVQAIAMLLKEKAQVHAELGDETAAFNSWLKSLQLFLRDQLGNGEAIVADSAMEIRILLERLRPYELPSPAKKLLAEWLRHTGQYAQAENVLHELLQDGLLPLTEAQQFYQQLLLLTDDQLLQGGLARDEVLDALRLLPT